MWKLASQKLVGCMHGMDSGWHDFNVAVHGNASKFIHGVFTDVFHAIEQNITTYLKDFD